MKFYWIVERNIKEYLSREGYTKMRVYPEIVREFSKDENFEIFRFKTQNRLREIFHNRSLLTEEAVLCNIHGRYLLFVLFLRLFKLAACKLVVIYYGSDSILYRWILKGMLRRQDGLLVMNRSQALGFRCSVYNFRYGLDFQYFAQLKKTQANEPSENFALMHGDELRLDNSLLEVANRIKCKVRRVRQYPEKGHVMVEKYINANLNTYVNLSDDDLYSMLAQCQFYLGLVDSSWQPAGWTAAIEALALGKEVIIVDGLTSDLLITSFPELSDRIHVFKQRNVKSIIEFINSRSGNWRDYGLTNVFTLEDTIADFKYIFNDYNSLFR